MPSLRLSRVCYSYADPIDVFTDVSLQLEPGWTAIVGENGGGKTTLLRLIAGELEPSAGELRVPGDAVVVLCRQRVERLSPEVEAFAWAWDRAAIRWRDRLALEPEDLERWSTLSPGERKRWQVGAALWGRPDVLLLDEPSNHLDAATRALVADALARYRGVGVLVSHDRALLDRLVTSTVRLAGGRAHAYRGDYSAAREQWERESAERRAAQGAAQRQRKSLARRLADERRNRAQAACKISARARMKSVRDSDARSVNARARVANGEARAARKVAVLRGAVERADEALAEHALDRERAGRLFVDHEAAPKRRLINLALPALVAGDRVLARGLGIVVERDTRLVITGTNGSGKTTLLRALRDAAGVPPERVLSLAQELGADAGVELVRRLCGLDRGARGRVLQVAAALGLDPDRVLSSERPSPGEARKLAIADGLGRSVWLALLDEPTNHLDLPSIERLERALAAYPGALIVVSHDRRFADAVAGPRRTDLALGLEPE